MSTKLNREAILAAKGLKSEQVKVPEWGEGGEVTIKELTAGEAQVLAARARDNEDEAMLLWVIAGVRNEDGSRMFTDEDKEYLALLSASAILRVGGAMVKLCGFGADDAKETEKNLKANRTKDSV